MRAGRGNRAVGKPDGKPSLAARELCNKFVTKRNIPGVPLGDSAACPPLSPASYTSSDQDIPRASSSASTRGSAAAVRRQEPSAL